MTKRLPPIFSRSWGQLQWIQAELFKKQSLSIEMRYVLSKQRIRWKWETNLRQIEQPGWRNSATFFLFLFSNILPSTFSIIIFSIAGQLHTKLTIQNAGGKKFNNFFASENCDFFAVIFVNLCLLLEKNYDWNPFPK